MLRTLISLCLVLPSYGIQVQECFIKLNFFSLSHNVQIKRVYSFYEWLLSGKYECISESFAPFILLECGR